MALWGWVGRSAKAYPGERATFHAWHGVWLELAHTTLYGISASGCGAPRSSIEPHTEP